MPDLDAGANPLAPAIHYSSHAELLQPYEPSTRRRIDAVVVSAARQAENLQPALRLAAALQAPVVVLCSRAARPDDAAVEAARVPGLTSTVVDLAERPGAGLPGFETSKLVQAQVDPHGDLSRKRNLGLLLGRLVGWTRLLFLDDDISGLDPPQVEQAAAGLDRYAAIGMPARSFPDNSIACHARRRSGAEQDVFVSGSALAVCEPATNSFFPDIYNEDWLFLAPHLDRREVATMGSVVQQPYDPFADPDRAGAQEFGEVLAEGLVGHLHAARLHPVPRRAYWADFLDARGELLAATYEECLAAAVEDDVADAALAALASARQALAGISADDLVHYVEAWLADLATWRRAILDLPRLGGLDAALRHLDLAARTESSDPRVEPPAARERPDRTLCDPTSTRRARGE